MRLRVVLGVAALIAGALLIGLGQGEWSNSLLSGLNLGSARDQGQKVPPLTRAIPSRIIIPTIGVDSPIEPVGLDDSGGIVAPSLDEPTHTGWYRDGPSPGELGPAVIIGHVDTRSRPAIFHKLHKLRYGHTIEVLRADGVIAVFRVESGTIYNKKSFPSRKIFTDSGRATLRLVTCGGRFDRKRDSYTHNIVVYAALVSTRHA